MWVINIRFFDFGDALFCNISFFKYSIRAFIKLRPARFSHWTLIIFFWWTLVSPPFACVFRITFTPWIKITGFCLFLADLIVSFRTFRMRFSGNNFAFVVVEIADLFVKIIWDIWLMGEYSILIMLKEPISENISGRYRVGVLVGFWKSGVGFKIETRVFVRIW